MESQSVEDYLEVIYQVLMKKEKASTGDIASKLGVKSSSVTEMLQRLSERGYIYYEKYSGATLSDQGEEIAKNVSEVHKNLKKLLKLLQVPSEQADEDACKMEHDLTEKSVEQLSKFIEFVEQSPEDEVRWLEHFHYYSKNSEFPPDCGVRKKGEKNMLTATQKKLSEMEYGQTGVIKSIEDELKQKLAGRGIREGKELRMDTKQPIDGPVVFTIDGSMTSIGLELAKKMYVEIGGSEG